jgi:hypothetical protein
MIEPSTFLSHQAALAHLGERQTEVNFCPSCLVQEYSGGTVFDPQKRHFRFVSRPYFATQTSPFAQIRSR